MHTHLGLSGLKLLLLPELPRGFRLMQSHTCCSSMESGTNTTGTSKLAPSLICIPAAKMDDKHTITQIYLERLLTFQNYYYSPAFLRLHELILYFIIKQWNVCIATFSLSQRDGEDFPVCGDWMRASGAAWVFV